MHIHQFDHYQSGDTAIHQLDPRVKLVITVGFIFSNVLLPDGAWWAFLGAWLVVLAASLFAGLSPRFLLSRSLVALPFALAAVTVIFTLPGEPVLSVKAGPWIITATAPGLVRFTSILLRSWVSIQAAILLTATTTFPDLVHGMRHLHFPTILVAIISFMYRYLFVLADEVLRLLRARESRSAGGLAGQKAGGGLAWRAGVAGSMAGQLFLRSYERSDRVYQAMLARGYQGTLLTLNTHIMRAADWTALAIALTAIILVHGIARIF